MKARRPAGQSALRDLTEASRILIQIGAEPASGTHPDSL
jgi:hypothetical protein